MTQEETVSEEERIRHEEKMRLLEEAEGIVGHSTASNNWVISGKHTKNGMPLLSTDPHLSSVIPCFWQLQELIWGNRYVTGASLVGMPGIGLGRNKDFAWGLTAQIGDNSDIWQEQLNEAETHYKVDGEWRELEVIREVIKVKGQDDIVLDVKKTHRGPIIGIE